MPIQTQRPLDTKVEHIITNWLNKYYFPKIFSDYKIVSDVNLQIKGIDIIADGAKYDIKAQASKKYLNNPTNTYSVEISSLDRKGYEHVGWFIDSKLITDYYMFVWIPDCEHTEGVITKINKLEVLIVDKAKLLNKVTDEFDNNTSKSMTPLQVAATMRTSYITPKYIGFLKFVCSTHLFEQPVNIVLKKDILESCATRHDIVTQPEVKPILGDLG